MFSLVKPVMGKGGVNLYGLKEIDRLLNDLFFSRILQVHLSQFEPQSQTAKAKK